MGGRGGEGPSEESRGGDSGNLEEAERSSTPENTLTHCMPLLASLSGPEASDANERADERAPLSSSHARNQPENKPRRCCSSGRLLYDDAHTTTDSRRCSVLSPADHLSCSFGPTETALSSRSRSCHDPGPSELTVLRRLDQSDVETVRNAYTHTALEFQGPSSVISLSLFLPSLHRQTETSEDRT